MCAGTPRNCRRWHALTRWRFFVPTASASSRSSRAARRRRARAATPVAPARRRRAATGRQAAGTPSLATCLGARCPDWLAVGCSGRHVNAAGAAIAQRIDHHGELLASLQGSRAPAVAKELAGRTHFHAPLLLPRRALHQQLDEAVWIGPLEGLDRALQRDGAGGIEHGAGVVGERAWTQRDALECQRQGGSQHALPETNFHWNPPW